MTKRFLISSIFLLMTSCNTVSSSYHYTKGTEAIQCGDYDTALTHLQECVDLDPSLGRNQNNLAALHMNMGQVEMAWQPLCKAVWLPMDPATNQKAVENFIATWNWMREHHHIEKGLPMDEVIHRLGEPTSINQFGNRDGCVLTYGLLMLCIEQGILDHGVLLVDGKSCPVDL